VSYSFKRIKIEIGGSIKEEKSHIISKNSFKKVLLLNPKPNNFLLPFLTKFKLGIISPNHVFYPQFCGFERLAKKIKAIFIEFKLLKKKFQMFFFYFVATT